MPTTPPCHSKFKPLSALSQQPVNGMQAAVARGAGSAAAAEVLCRRALAARIEAAGGADTLATASVQCLLAQVLCDLARCAAPLMLAAFVERPRGTDMLLADVVTANSTIPRLTETLQRSKSSISTK